MLKRPSSQQVAVAWLKQLTELEGVDVATTLPVTSQWTGQDFVTVDANLGGIPNAYLPVHVPVVQLDFWAKAPNSNRPAWNRAATTAQAVFAACYVADNGLIVIPGGFIPASLHSVIPMSEPRRIDNDPAATARYTMDVQLSYSSAMAMV